MSRLRVDGSDSMLEEKIDNICITVPREKSASGSFVNFMLNVNFESSFHVPDASKPTPYILWCQCFLIITGTIYKSLNRGSLQFSVILKNAYVLRQNQNVSIKKIVIYEIIYITFNATESIFVEKSDRNPENDYSILCAHQNLHKSR